MTDKFGVTQGDVKGYLGGEALAGSATSNITARPQPYGFGLATAPNFHPMMSGMHFSAPYNNINNNGMAPLGAAGPSFSQNAVPFNNGNAAYAMQNPATAQLLAARAPSSSLAAAPVQPGLQPPFAPGMNLPAGGLPGSMPSGFNPGASAAALSKLQQQQQQPSLQSLAPSQPSPAVVEEPQKRPLAHDDVKKGLDMDIDSLLARVHGAKISTHINLGASLIWAANFLLRAIDGGASNVGKAAAEYRALVQMIQQNLSCLERLTTGKPLEKGLLDFLSMDLHALGELAPDAPTVLQRAARQVQSAYVSQQVIESRREAGRESEAKRVRLGGSAAADVAAAQLQQNLAKPAASQPKMQQPQAQQPKIQQQQAQQPKMQQPQMQQPQIQQPQMQQPPVQQPPVQQPPVQQQAAQLSYPPQLPPPSSQLNPAAVAAQKQAMLALINNGPQLPPAVELSINERLQAVRREKPEMDENMILWLKARMLLLVREQHQNALKENADKVKNEHGQTASAQVNGQFGGQFNGQCFGQFNPQANVQQGPQLSGQALPGQQTAGKSLGGNPHPGHVPGKPFPGQPGPAPHARLTTQTIQTTNPPAQPNLVGALQNMPQEERRAALVKLQTELQRATLEYNQTMPDKIKDKSPAEQAAYNARRPLLQQQIRQISQFIQALTQFRQ